MRHKTKNNKDTNNPIPKVSLFKKATFVRKTCLLPVRLIVRPNPDTPYGNQKIERLQETPFKICDSAEPTELRQKLHFFISLRTH